MLKKRSTKLLCLLIAFLWTTVIIGSSYAYFIDSVTVTGNVVTTGNLKAEMSWKNPGESTWKDASDGAIFDYQRWEPGYTDVKYIKVDNTGALAFQYELNVFPAELLTGRANLLDVLEVYYGEGVDGVTRENYATELTYVGTLTDLLTNEHGAAYGILLPAEGKGSTNVANVDAPKGSVEACLVLHMQETAGNEYQNLSVGDGFKVQLAATQYMWEKDSFGHTYDQGAKLPELEISTSMVIDVTPVNGLVPYDVWFNDPVNGVSATVPAGAKMAEGATSLKLVVEPKANSDADVTLSKEDELSAYNVKVEGLAADNAVPVIINMGKAMSEGMNQGNYDLYHVENGVTTVMTRVDSAAELDAHNEFFYNPATGEVIVAMATFSEIAVVSDTENAWKGKFDYSWYSNAIEANADEKNFVIANADQLAAFSAIVGGMAKDESENAIAQDSFKNKTVKLVADVNLGDKESENDPDLIFYPIGYYNTDGTYEKTGTAITSGFKNFEGTFDGQGHTIANFYQNTWEMKGDNNYYDAKLQYYRDGMGLFGKVYGGTVKNLTVDNFSSDGEYTTTGVIAAYADGATFENIAITNCNPRVYNIGNGGIVGCVGWYAKEADLKTTFTNITVDNTNKISALWGSYDVACGGVVGQYYPTSGQTSAGSPKNAGIDLVNCHVSAQMDVYNDVCGNYQYYAYRYAGMIIGSIRENTTTEDGKYVIPDMTGISATGCTVNYGTWNDYYYCEFEKNGHPSYSGPDDYKFSRVPHSELNFTDSNGNGIIDTEAERASVTGCKHDHTEAEDNRAIYLPFHQLFTGYGWGVNSVGLKEYSGIVTNLDITEGDQEESVVKFKKVDIDNNSYTTGITVNIGKLFAAVEPDEYDLVILDDKVQVFVSPVGDDSSAGATYVANTTEWTQGTLTFTGVGAATITITDYYFCTPTTINVTVDPADKFEVAFDHDPVQEGKQNNLDKYLYRVGNEDDVAWKSLFAAIVDESKIGTVDVSVETIKGNAEGNYSDGTIHFSGTGVVKVTIKDETSNPCSLYLEVVDAFNVTKYSELKDQNSVVLLSDITMSDGGTYRLIGNKVLYGNGFTFDVKNGAYTGVDYDSESYVIYLEDSRLDNVRITGAVYPKVGGTKSDDYNRAIVMTFGDCAIVNSYISNGASPIRNGGNLELVNTTLKGGAYANLDLRNGHLILDNVTTINQIGANDKYNENTEIIGLGIVVYQEGGTEDLKITIRNKLTQYNYISKEQADTYITSTYGKAITLQMFNNSFPGYMNDSKWVNTGIISMNNYFTEEDLVDERTDKSDYFGTDKSVTLVGQSRDCYVYSFKPTSASAPDYPGYTTAGQGVIEPNVVFDFTERNYVAKTEGSNDYCYEDGGVVYISMDEGDTFNWDTSILTAAKNGDTLNYTVTMDGNDYTGKSIAFNEKGTYEVIYSYEDGYNFKLENGEVTNFVEDYTETVTINVAVVEAAAKHAEFSFGANGTAYSAKTVEIGNKTYVMPDVTATVSGKIGSTTVNGTTVYYPITEMYTSDGKTEHNGTWYACFPIFKDAVQIIDYANGGTGDAVTYNQKNVTTVAGIPSTLKATNPTSAFLYQMNATNYPPPTDPTAVSDAVCYTCNRNGLTSGNARDEMTIFAEYTYTDNAGAVYYYYIGYHCAAQTKGSTSTCLAEGTMITLADGSKRAVEDLRKGDMVMAYDHVTGEVTTNKVIIVVKTGSDFYQNTFVFDDGSKLVTINEHGIYDLNLNRYVNIDHLNAKDYIGHDYVAIDPTGRISTKKLVAVESEYISGYKYDIVSENTLNYVAEDTLSVTHVLVDIINTFEFNEDMCYDQAKMEADIQQYGLYTYDEWQEYADIAVFEEYNIPVMKVGVSKGMYTKDYIISLINTFVLDDSVQIID